ncbi:peptide chain release factor 1 [bacterium]|jgi:peptide chain release factor 1|nr:peptide chain release factor 1 [bacterium]MBT4764321.1 peptide chain release factor 1 [bacterium]MBT5401692.1 peptide chain release factor 1 [bacterium]MBT5942133.1 peptide chain release factor 1 [bacterium]MBT6068066.1 peptide chain release factor 1 [bacterium]
MNNLEKKLKEFKDKFDELERNLQSADVINDPKKLGKLSKEYNEVKEIIDHSNELNKVSKEIKELNESLTKESDEELIKMTEEELQILYSKETELNTHLTDLLNPKDPLDKKNIIMEIRAGTGGDESALFAADLFKMYSKYAEAKGFKTKLISQNKTTIGGFKEIIFEIEGQNVYGNLKYESGVHRVQRVPETEKSGRIHTSAATVAVLPEAEEVDMSINQKDLRIDTFCAGGHGGQSVNTTYSAVRITHLPTNIAVSCQDERSQLQNKLRAMTILRSRLLAHQEEKRRKELSDNRKGQIGTGDRSEKIRTYNFPQDRMTDHRIKLTLHNLDKILNGNIDEIIANLKAEASKEV